MKISDQSDYLDELSKSGGLEKCGNEFVIHSYSYVLFHEFTLCIFLNTKKCFRKYLRLVFYLLTALLFYQIINAN